MKVVSVIMLLACAFLLPACETVRADEPVQIGNSLTLPAVANALQSGGFQALLSNSQSVPAGVLGKIISGINGISVDVLGLKCKDSQDEICALAFKVTFNDAKNIINTNSLNLLNKKMIFAKAVSVDKPNASGMRQFNVVYMFFCRGLTDTRFVVPLLKEFGSDLARASKAYTSGALASPPVPQ